jgi:hypothetical protein
MVSARWSWYRVNGGGLSATALPVGLLGAAGAGASAPGAGAGVDGDAPPVADEAQALIARTAAPRMDRINASGQQDDR